jgi:hypothetical protein
VCNNRHIHIAKIFTKASALLSSFAVTLVTLGFKRCRVTVLSRISFKIPRFSGSPAHSEWAYIHQDHHVRRNALNTKLVIKTSFLTSVITIVVVLIVFSLTSATLAQTPQPGQGTGVEPNSGAGDIFLSGLPGLLENDQDLMQATTQYLHLSGSTFTQMYSDTGITYFTGGCVYHSSGSASYTFMNTALILPPEATITSMRFYYYDNSASDSTLRLRKMNDGNPDWSDVASLDSAGTPGLSYASVSGLDYDLDYTNYSYVLQYQGNVIGNSMRLCGVRIGYTTPNTYGIALPAIIK